MKKTILNNKGFAISGIVYTILLVFVIILSTILLILINRKVILDKSKNEILKELNGEEDYKVLSLKERIESDTSHIKKNVKVNGEIVNKVIGTKDEKLTMNNYIWYMGNLWQVLETNDTNNTIKLITAQSITSIAYGETSDYNSSWVKKWLNEVFYKSLEGTELVRDTTFCLDGVITESTEEDNMLKVSSHTPINTCQNKITEKVGLMTFEDYVYSNNGNKPIYMGGSYLDEDELEWTITKYDNNKMWIQWHSSPANITVKTNYDFSIVKGYGHGVRPVISIDGNALFKEGDGTKANPYILINEKKANSGSKINSVKVGDYVFLDESNNPNKFTEEYVARDLKYTSTKDKVRYRVVKKNSDGTVKVERADVIKNLSNNIAINLNMYIPFYYKADKINGCYYDQSGNSWYISDCENNNIFKVTNNTNEYNYQSSINIGDYLNSSSNSFYNWYSNETKNMIKETEYDRYTGGHGKDYSNLNNNETGTYPETTNDGKVTAKVVLPTWGEMYSGNDLNITYWYMNRWLESTSGVSIIHGNGFCDGNIASNIDDGVRPVVTLKSEVKIKDGEGTMTKPYNLYM